MTLLEWKPGYETGIAAVDYEHRRLIGLINKLHHQLAQPGQRATVSAFFGDLYAEIAAHFALEERVMRQRAYPAYGLHKADHERLLDEIRDLMDEYETSLDDASRDTLRERLEAWFLRHFHAMDAPLHAATGEQG
jgi:hemerythrin-like metal-binding protein